MTLCKRYCIESLGESTNLVHLDQDRVTGLEVDTLLQTNRVGHVEVVTDELKLVAELCSDVSPTGPVVFIQWVFDGNQWEVANELCVVGRHFFRGALVALEVVRTILEEFRCSNVECQTDFLAWLKASLLDSAHDELKCCTVVGEVRSESTLVTKTSSHTVLLQQ